MYFPAMCCFGRGFVLARPAADATRSITRVPRLPTIHFAALVTALPTRFAGITSLLLPCVYFAPVGTGSPNQSVQCTRTSRATDANRWGDKVSGLAAPWCYFRLPPPARLPPRPPPLTGLGSPFLPTRGVPPQSPFLAAMSCLLALCLLSLRSGWAAPTRACSVRGQAAPLTLIVGPTVPLGDLGGHVRR